ncbi:hypothetical protein T484DRAFT_1861025 [Baffinella frigidus]|nr:hypothetical protein T484DRAFT_1861025 [Cryptophyta sp. CCMP2293]
MTEVQTEVQTGVQTGDQTEVPTEVQTEAPLVTEDQQVTEAQKDPPVIKPTKEERKKAKQERRSDSDDSVWENEGTADVTKDHTQVKERFETEKKTKAQTERDFFCAGRAALLKSEYKDLRRFAETTPVMDIVHIAKFIQDTYQMDGLWNDHEYRVMVKNELYKIFNALDNGSDTMESRLMERVEHPGHGKNGRPMHEGYNIQDTIDGSDGGSDWGSDEGGGMDESDDGEDGDDEPADEEDDKPDEYCTKHDSDEEISDDDGMIISDDDAIPSSDDDGEEGSSSGESSDDDEEEGSSSEESSNDDG